MPFLLEIGDQYRVANRTAFLLDVELVVLVVVNRSYFSSFIETLRRTFVRAFVGENQALAAIEIISAVVNLVRFRVRMLICNLIQLILDLSVPISVSLKVTLGGLPSYPFKLTEFLLLLLKVIVIVVVREFLFNGLLLDRSGVFCLLALPQFPARACIHCNPRVLLLRIYD